MSVSAGAVVAAKNWKPILIGFLCSIGGFVVIIAALISSEEEEQQFVGDGLGGQSQVSAQVRAYEPLVRKYAEKYGIPDYVELLLAKMMQESGGRGGDPMQSSESIGLPPNGISDPEQSIDVGVKYFAGMLKKAEGDIKLTLQAYNFGGGFIPYALERGGYSKEVAEAFSQEQAKKLGWSRYGDVNYVDNVLRYYTGGSYAGSDMPVNAYGFIQPVDTEVTSHYGNRVHPITGVPTLHGGTDYSCKKQPIPVHAIKSGVVTKAGWENPKNPNQGFGQRIYIDHGATITSVTAHLSTMLVKVGQKVEQGQVIGKCGTTGSSTGMHVHLEIHVNGSKQNPMQFVAK